ncbi:MAG: hypothetical protein ACFFD4_22340 [Candidatus Odinarchaeota archaeon]
MAIISDLVLNSIAEAKCWVLEQVSSLKIENIARLLDLVPCPFAYGALICKINPGCHAKVDRRIQKFGKVQYYCFYEDIPVVSEEIIIPVTAGLIALYLPEPDMIDKVAKLLFIKDHVKEENRIFAEMYMFSSTYLGQLIEKKDTCLPCMYRSEVKKWKRNRPKTVSKIEKDLKFKKTANSVISTKMKQSNKSKLENNSAKTTKAVKTTSRKKKQPKRKVGQKKTAGKRSIPPV